MHQRKSSKAQYQACPGGGREAHGRVAQVCVTALVVIGEVEASRVLLPTQTTLAGQSTTPLVENQTQATLGGNSGASQAALAVRALLWVLETVHWGDGGKHTGVTAQGHRYDRKTGEKDEERQLRHSAARRNPLGARCPKTLSTPRALDIARGRLNPAILRVRRTQASCSLSPAFSSVVFRLSSCPSVTLHKQPIVKGTTLCCLIALVP